MKVVDDPARRKLEEAQFFLKHMEHTVDIKEFGYNFSAFLSALKSASAHLKLYSRDPQFKNWWAKIKSNELQDPDLRFLYELRDEEVHRIRRVKEAIQINVSFGGGFQVPPSSSVEIPIPLPGQPKPASSIEYDVSYKWVFDRKDSPGVLDICRKGLAVVEQILEGRDKMAFK